MVCRKASILGYCLLQSARASWNRPASRRAFTSSRQEAGSWLLAESACATVTVDRSGDVSAKPGSPSGGSGIPWLAMSCVFLKWPACRALIRAITRTRAAREIRKNGMSVQVSVARPRILASTQGWVEGVYTRQHWPIPGSCTMLYLTQGSVSFRKLSPPRVRPRIRPARALQRGKSGGILLYCVAFRRRCSSHDTRNIHQRPL